MSQPRSVELIGWRDVIALIALVGIWISLLWRAFDPASSFALFMDNEFFTGTVLAAMAAAFDGGEWPLRMTTALGGLPLYNFTQFSPFYPFYFVALPLFDTPIDASMSMHWITLLHVILFAVNMFVLLRVIGTTRLAAVTGASLVAFGANSLAYAVWLQIVAPYAWLPLYLAGLIGILENRTPAKYTAMAVAGIVMLVLASPSQPLIHALLVTCVLVLFRLWHSRLDIFSHATWASLSRLGAVGTVAFMLSAPAILPALIEFKDMIRWVGPFAPVTGHERIPFEAFLTDQLSLAELGGALVNISRKAVGAHFIGPVAISLAVFGIVARSRWWITSAMVTLALYALASSTGSNLGLAYVNYVIPMVNKIREPSRFLFLFQLAMGILAAIGIDELRRMAVNGQLSSIPWRRAALVVSIALVTMALAVRLREHGADFILALIGSSLLIIAFISSTLVARTSWRFRGEVIGLGWSAAALAVLAVNVNWTPLPIAASNYLKNDGVALDMAINRVAELDPRHDYRLIFEGSVDKQMAAMLASYRNVRTLTSYFNPAPLRQFNELYHHGPRKDNYLQVLGARYLICRDCEGIEYRGFSFRESKDGYDIHEATDALAYVQLARRLDGYFDGMADFIAKAAGHDLSTGLLFAESGATPNLDNKARDENDCIVHNDIRKKNRIRYLVSCESPSVLILNEFYADPWRVSVNGVNTDVLRVNGNQIGVQLSAGGHLVEFSYRPWIFSISIFISVLGVLLMLIWIGKRMVSAG